MSAGFIDNGRRPSGPHAFRPADTRGKSAVPVTGLLSRPS